ncbi:MAG TPA: glycosyltransferase family 2 protein [Solirubrobacteraceae bacterium]|jgi:glycosyltransferase involved in cell wall biosynthesis|nr:glycosyltransferase family 2 protein [Solirubrobacteraceae bacterium]
MPVRHTPRVSVLMPAHNAEQTIVDAVASALAQTMSELEVIVVDDGSAQPVAPALEAVRDERVRIFRSVANRGVSAARNSALAAARAPVVAQLDADDLWKTDHLEGVLAGLDDPRVGLVYANAEVIGHPRGARVWIPDRALGASELAMQSASVRHPVNDLPTLYRGNPIPAPTVMMRTQAARRAGGYPRWLTVGEDYLLYIRLLQAGWRFAFVDRTSAVYRWPEPGRGATFNRRRNARQQLKLLLALLAASPGDPVLQAQLPRRLAEIVETHFPGSVWIARSARRMLSVGPGPADKI